jgi:hypothetical protein
MSISKNIKIELRNKILFTWNSGLGKLDTLPVVVDTDKRNPSNVIIKIIGSTPNLFSLYKMNLH